MRIRPAVTLPLLIALAAAAFVAAGTPAPAAAKGTPCWEQVINDWLDNGTIDHRYKAVCYQQALKHVPEDLRDYSNITDAITAALQNSLRGGSGGGPGGANGGFGSGSGTGGGDSGTGAGKNRTLQVAPPRSYYRRAIDNLGSTSASSLPIPLLVLAGLGSALLLSAGGLAARKRLKARSRPDA